MTTRLGTIPLKVPQVRGGVDFCPSSLERGLRSERAVKLAVAEMYVQGVSTRRVTQVMQQMCGCEVSSTQVSRAAALLDEVGAGDNWKADVNNDTRINILDLIFVRNKLNTQCP